MCRYLDFSKRTSNVVTTFANLQMTKNVYTHLKLAGMGPLHAHYKITCIYYAYTKLNAFALIWYTLNINESVTINYLRTNFWIFSLRVRQDLLLKIAIMHACNICLLYIWTLMALYSGRCFLNHSCWRWYSNWRLGTIPKRRYTSVSISVPTNSPALPPKHAVEHRVQAVVQAAKCQKQSSYLKVAHPTHFRVNVPPELSVQYNMI